MYFQKFPLTFYSLDNRATVQVVTNFLLRSVFSDEIKNNFTAFDEYDIKDGETPETLAFEIYGDTNLHWIILHANDILDPRFDWPLDTFNLKRFAEGKYSNINAVHHFEDTDGNTVNGNVTLQSSAEFTSFTVGSAIVNNTNEGVGFVTSKASDSSMNVRVTKGGFQAGNQFSLASNTLVTANITSTTILSGIPVTNLVYEDRENETKRRIRILKPQFIERLVREFDSKLAQINE